MSCQSRFDARYWMLGDGALGRPRGMVWGGRMEEGSGWGTHVYLWQIHFDIWQNQYNIVKLNKIKLKKKEIINIFVITHLTWQEVFTHERKNIQDNLTSLGNLRKLNWGKKITKVPIHQVSILPSPKPYCIVRLLSKMSSGIFICRNIKVLEKIHPAVIDHISLIN